MNDGIDKVRSALQTLQRIDTFQFDGVDLNRIETAKRDLRQAIELFERETQERTAA